MAASVGQGFSWGVPVLILGVLFLALLVAGVVLAALFAVRLMRSRGSSENDDALKVLRMRYAKGEIDREKYEQMKRDLEA